MAKTAVAPYKRRKQYSPGFVIWTIIKYASLIFFAFMAVLPIVSCVIHQCYDSATELAEF